MIPAGIRDHSTVPLLIAQRSDLVVGATQFKGTDRLEVFRLEIKLPVVSLLR